MDVVVFLASLFTVITLIVWALHASEEANRQKVLENHRPRLTTLLDELVEALRANESTLPDIIKTNHREISHGTESRVLSVWLTDRWYHLVVKSFADGDAHARLFYERAGFSEDHWTPYLKPKDRLRHAWLFERFSRIAEIAGETQSRHSVFTPVAVENAAPPVTDL
jgi:hypothetical protein